jgi:NAD-dependent dihydropyrimidine dehydrogenase PreA subunit
MWLFFSLSRDYSQKTNLRGFVMFLPKIDEQKCKQCGECVDVCPADVLAIEGDTTVVTAPQECLGCESCISVCPEDAITVEEI